MNSGYISGIEIISKTTSEKFEDIILGTGTGGTYNVTVPGAFDAVYRVAVIGKPIFISTEIKSEFLQINGTSVSPCQTLVAIDPDTGKFVRITTQVAVNPGDMKTFEVEVSEFSPNTMSFKIY